MTGCAGAERPGDPRRPAPLGAGAPRPRPVHGPPGPAPQKKYKIYKSNKTKPGENESVDQSRFIRGLLDDPRDPQLPQYDPAAGWSTLKYLGQRGAAFTGPGGVADAFGLLGEPSVAEQARRGDYLSAGLTAAGAIPIVGPLAKAGLGAKMAMAAVPAAGKAAKAVKRAPAGLLSGAEAIEPGDIRISTRFPTGKTATEDPLRQHLSIGVNEMQAEPEKFAYNVGLLSDYPGFAKLRGMAPDEAASAYVDQTRGNLQYLYDRSPTIVRERSPHWYDGANRIAQALSERYGIPLQSAGGAIAALSPQMDWFKNASLAERVGDVIFDPSKQRIAMTPEMQAYAASPNANWTRSNPKNQAIFDRIAGKSLNDIDPEDFLGRAMWTRMYDEAHNPRSYRTITPEGEFGDFATNMDGSQSKVGWGALGEIGKAVRSFTSSGDMDTISRAMGDKHKVRSFNNNITVPNDPRYGDVTIDTHQVAAGQLRPLSGKSHAVAHNLATSVEAGMKNAKGSDVSGVQGTYGLIADATRQAAQPYGLLGRQMQSATWEPVRELFSAAAKRGSLPDQVDAIWRAHDAGDLTLQQARDLIYETAGGIGTPAWARPDLERIDPRRGSSYR